MKNLAALFALALGGCAAGHDFTRVEVEFDAPLVAHVELIDPPVSEETFEQFEIDPPAEQFHGGVAIKGYGNEAGGKIYLQDGGETTWAFAVDVPPTAEQLASARRTFARLSELLPNWTFVELPAHNGQTDIVLQLSDPEKRGSEGCYDALASGACWFASARCAKVISVPTGDPDVKVCEQSSISIGQHGVDGFAESAELDRAVVWDAMFLHEIGHTLGLDHAPRSTGSIMKAKLPIEGWLGRAEQATFSACELAQLRGYYPMPGAEAPLAWHDAPECEEL